MSKDNSRAADARRHDDHALVESAAETPDQGGRSGGTLQRDIGTRAEEETLLEGKSGVTRVRKSDEAE